jgi:hypothetical protein
MSSTAAKCDVKRYIKADETNKALTEAVEETTVEEFELSTGARPNKKRAAAMDGQLGRRYG